MQAASAFRSDLVCSAKARNMRARRIAHLGERWRLERFGDARRAAPTPSTRWMPSPPKMALRTRCGMRERQERRDARAHGIAHHVGAGEIEMIEQRAHVVGHQGAVVGGRVVELGRSAMPAVVERDGAPAGALSAS